MNDTRRTRVVLGVLLLVSLLLITIDERGGEQSPLRGLRGFGAAVFGPVERVAAAVVRPVSETYDTIVGSGRARERIQQLEAENERLRERLRTGQLDKSRADQLDQLLHTAGLGGYRVVAAEVISIGQGLEETVTIDAGSRAGIKPDMTVIAGGGLVGRITRVGPATSTVLLATDVASSVGGRLEDSREIGFVQGTGRRGLGADTTPLAFRLLDTSAPLIPGQRIVTFGSQGERPYVPGIPIGTVTKIEQTPGSLTRTASVTPFVRFTSLDVVGVVVRAPTQDPRDAVLPPKPGPSSPPAGRQSGPSSSPSSNPPSSPPAGGGLAGPSPGRGG